MNEIDRCSQTTMVSTNSTPVTNTDPEKQAQNSEDCAWKSIGYPGFCEFSALDDDFLVLRRFGALNIRVLLDLQFQIMQVEAHLCHLDQACRDDTDLDSTANRMDSLAWDFSEHNKMRKRGTLLRELQPLIHTYNNQVASFIRIKQQDTASKVQRRNVQNWFKDHENAVVSEEQDYIQHASDLITLSQRYKSPLQRFCELVPFLQWLFWKRRIVLPGFERGVHVGSDDAMHWFADSITIFLGLMMLYGPLWWLLWLSDDVHRLALITCFIFVFAVGLRAVGTVKPFEVLAATAAYAAVLMVFLQKQASDA